MTTTQLIINRLSLLPFGILLAACNNFGLNVSTKADAIEQLLPLVSNDTITIDQIKRLRPSLRTDTSSPSSTQVSTQGIEAQAAALETAQIAREAYEKAGNLKHSVTLLGIEQTDFKSSLSDFNSKLTDFEKSFGGLESKINAKLSKKGESLNKSELDSIVRTSVSELFNQFRKERTVQELEEIAEDIPAVRNSTAADVFGASATVYDDVDFGSLPVLLWNDPEAPELVDDYVFNPAALHQALIALDDPLPDNVWLAGERGTGKTEFVSQIAARLQRKLFRVNFDEALERADFIGGNTIKDSNVVWQAGIITQAISHAGSIVLLDEIGFARAQSLAALHALCERSPHRSITVSETGQRIKVASHVAFFGADNSNGYGDTSGNFAGVREQNSAFIDRFGYTIRFDYLPADKEAELIATRTNLSLEAAKALVVFANTAREKARAGLLTQPPSLRQLFAWARSIQKGFPVEKAFENAIVNKYPEDCAAELIGAFTASVDVALLKQLL
jgi:MoxR-like ATPase